VKKPGAGCNIIRFAADRDSGMGIRSLKESVLSAPKPASLAFQNLFPTACQSRQGRKILAHRFIGGILVWRFESRQGRKKPTPI